MYKNIMLWIVFRLIEGQLLHLNCLLHCGCLENYKCSTCTEDGEREGSNIIQEIYQNLFNSTGWKFQNNHEGNMEKNNKKKLYSFMNGKSLSIWWENVFHLKCLNICRQNLEKTKSQN